MYFGFALFALILRFERREHISAGIKISAAKWGIQTPDSKRERGGVMELHQLKCLASFRRRINVFRTFSLNAAQGFSCSVWSSRWIAFFLNPIELRYSSLRTLSALPQSDNAASFFGSSPYATTYRQLRRKMIWSVLSAK
jgi:hypothetical protein